MKHVKTKPIKFVKTQPKPAQAKVQAKTPIKRAHKLSPKLETPTVEE